MLNRNTLALVSREGGHGCPGVVSSNDACYTHPAQNVQPDAAWNNTLLSGLLRRSGGGGNGTLYCHPAQQAEVTDWLRRHTHLGWRIEADASLDCGDVRLNTDCGELPLRW